MQYLGGKSRLSKSIVGSILADTYDRSVWYEPFVGGGSVLEKAAPHFKECFASDLSIDLILCWEAMSQGWRPPRSISFEEYTALRHAEPSPLRGYVGFACSFGGKWFGGYSRDRNTGRDMIDEAYRATVRKAESFSKVNFSISHYADLSPSGVVYCDPPYAGSMKYSAIGDFDHAEFWRVMNRWVDNGASVYVSEVSAPSDWIPILEIKRKIGRSMTPNGTGNNSALAVECVFRRL